MSRRVPSNLVDRVAARSRGSSSPVRPSPATSRRPSRLAAAVGPVGAGRLDANRDARHDQPPSWKSSPWADLVFPNLPGRSRARQAELTHGAVLRHAGRKRRTRTGAPDRRCQRPAGRDRRRARRPEPKNEGSKTDKPEAPKRDEPEPKNRSPKNRSRGTGARRRGRRTASEPGSEPATRGAPEASPGARPRTRSARRQRPASAERRRPRRRTTRPASAPGRGRPAAHTRSRRTQPTRKHRSASSVAASRRARTGTRRRAPSRCGSGGPSRARASSGGA